MDKPSFPLSSEGSLLDYLVEMPAFQMMDVMLASRFPSNLLQSNSPKTILMVKAGHKEKK